MTWRNCGSCKKPIALGSTYYACSVSTCKKAAYCSMPCFDEHSPVFRHKDAWAEERKAPLQPETSDAPLSRLATARIAPSIMKEVHTLPRDILIVGSKLKDYIRAKSSLNTSAAVLDRLSDMVRIMCD
ncbi:MAG TPA: hypothetical protein VEK06_05325, partial [Myxococcota bacterium]|nr:hypothetical protein [Myxococcota bacterium]